MLSTLGVTLQVLQDIDLISVKMKIKLTDEEKQEVIEKCFENGVFKEELILNKIGEVFLQRVG